MLNSLPHHQYARMPLHKVNNLNKSATQDSFAYILILLYFRFLPWKRLQFSVQLLASLWCKINKKILHRHFHSSVRANVRNPVLLILQTFNKRRKNIRPRYFRLGSNARHHNAESSLLNPRTYHKVDRHLMFTRDAKTNSSKKQESSACGKKAKKTHTRYTHVCFLTWRPQISCFEQP